MRFLLRVCLYAASAILLFAQSSDWQHAADLPGLDMKGLTPEQKTAVLKILRDQPCSCGCNMKLAECRVEDPACAYSTGLSTLVIKGVREGKTTDQILASLKSSPLAKGPAPRPILSDPVELNIAGAPARGPEDARVTIVEFSDFECPFCSKAVGEVAALMKMFPNDIRLVYKQFPLSMHPHARVAARAALAANAQGRFWLMHDELFANFRQLTPEHILEFANAINLDMARFKADIASDKFDAVIDNDLREGEEAGVFGTPAFFINGRLYNGPMEAAEVKPLIEAQLKKAAIVGGK